jgi:hypothetical protein
LDHPDLARPQSVAVGQLEHSSVARVIDDLNDAKHSVLLY